MEAARLSSGSDPWTQAMMRGDFAAAWTVSDRILRERIGRSVNCHGWPRHLQFVWNGHSIDDRHVLVRCYHGLGDTLQFVRLLAPLRRRARRVSLWVQPALLAILESVEGADHIFPLHDGAPEVEYDIDVELMELPHILRMTPADLPGRIPYLTVAPAAPNATDGQLNVGVAWRSGDWNPHRNVPDELLTRLRGIPNVRWFSLQFGYRSPGFLFDLACKDIRTLASRMCSLDLVLSVDTMIAHLAGALALPTWTLLRHECDWRWQANREDSPWYPTMRLLRQRREEDWSELIERVVRELRRLSTAG